jgi:glycosyltransferase involved in cell wall biosynthesis
MNEEHSEFGMLETSLNEKIEAAVDFSGIKSGGGVQLALNFLEEIKSIRDSRLNLHYIFPPEGALHSYGRTLNDISCIFSPPGVVSRLAFEHGVLQRWFRLKNIKVCYTYFGAGLPCPPSIASVVSVAYPIICYPESPYWSYVMCLPKLRARILNHARVQRLKKATTIVSETAVMQRRLARLLDRPEKEILVCPPAVTAFLTSKITSPVLTFNILCISGLSKHKNLWRLPEIAKELKRRVPPGIPDFKIHITASREAWISSLPSVALTIWEDVRDHFIFHGNVHPSDIQRLYSDADLLLSLSDLESFSNNYMEAWRARVPLVASNRDFAREICGSSAAYVEPHDPKAVARAILALFQDHSRQAAMREEGDQLLARLPSRCDKAKQILDLIVEGAPEIKDQQD